MVKTNKTIGLEPVNPFNGLAMVQPAIANGMVNARCPHCGERIGSDTSFFQVGDKLTDLAHAVCEIKQIEVSR